MKLATWNVNSIRSRLDRVLAWLNAHEPDVLCLQELKTTDEAFPFDPITAAGYHAAVYGQKTYNGVAILSRREPADVRRGFADGQEEDPQARLISAEVDGVRVFSAYVPNGRSVGDEAYAYKLAWFARLTEHLAANFAADQPLVVAGDTNVAVDDRDVNRPDEWADSVLCHADAREALTNLMAWGLEDVFRARNPEGGVYTFWDYRNLGFPTNNGLRIDHVLATAPLAARCTEATVDRDQRKGTKDNKPSDHAPVIVVFGD
jgi:exodeoxyribonuclease-3